MTATQAHPYMPNSTDTDRESMMAAVGISDIEELFEQIPADHRISGTVDLADGIRSEARLRRRLHQVLAKNTSTSEVVSFLGGGCWPHYVPAVCDEIAERAEFLTPVWGTPSSDHGRNQAWFEFASQLGELLTLDFVGLPVYSWGCAGGHAIRMAARLTGRHRVLLTGAMDPERRTVIETYCGPPGMDSSLELVPVAYDPLTGRMDLADLETKLDETVAAVYLDSPNHLGIIESDAARISAAVHEVGAEMIVGVDPLSLGLLAPPPVYGADIVVGSTQPLGVQMNAGGGVGGFIATRDEERYAREYPTLQVSLAGTRVPGQRAFGMTLFEQSSYGSREEGKDWTGNSVYLWAVKNAVYMALMGPAGFEEIGETIVRNSHEAARRISGIEGLTVRWPGGFFKEFVVDFSATGLTVAEVNEGLLERGVFGGGDLSKDFPDLGQSALYCVTEVHSREDIDKLVTSLEEVLAS